MSTLRVRYLISGLIGIFILSLFLLSQSAEAEMEGMKHNMPMEGMKMYMPIVSHGAHVLPEGKWRVKLHWTQMEDDEILDNGKEVSPDMDMEMNKVISEVYYGLPNDMHLRLVIPYVKNEMSGTMTMMGTAYGMKGEGKGLGDIMVILKKRLYNDMESGWSLAVGGGVKLPTGDNDEKFTDRNMMTKKFYDDFRLPISMQPGTGEIDPIFTTYATKSDERGSWHAHIMYIYTSKGDEDVDPGDKLMFHLARNIPLTDRFILVGEVNGMWQGDDDYPGRTISPGLDKHDMVVNLTPGIQFKPTENSTLQVAVKFPVINPDEGIVPKPMPYVGGHIKF